ncbi:hypothetical protein LX15_002520 [Streptoalloteichus tenebrarius]|uniref:DJ-1/PfpI domain-containing protein n=1 Tax=Streptoalloteichus tenebrarius (strain ATCC 17920 / DSM 40477 / JCM 4838 / CBS 697.72 / NBRC 16177 / NCIMB 11028 / NRRL B-12390 / A12253. 1 / ISP 5477) TaxID=1933 RepID=A0ABT1HTI7_STRSD|nr:hypothetical protein [Streptoalloteichus tenebrarius]BFE99494.1 hypothetical protein GCM10020241_11700 [Streptoalloteichus tenebrarius]
MSRPTPASASRALLSVSCVLPDVVVPGDGDPGFTVVYMEHAEPSQWELADVLVVPPRSNADQVDRAARETLRTYVGCSIVAAVCAGAGCVVVSRDGQRAELSGDPSVATDIGRFAAVAYAWLVAGRPLASLRPADVAAASLDWGRCEPSGGQRGSWRGVSGSDPLSRSRRRSARGLPRPR